MGVKVKIPLPWRSATGGQAMVDVSGSNLAEVFAALDAQFPGFKERLYDDDGEIKRFINVYVNSEDIRYLDELQTAVGEGDEVLIIPAVAGGGR